MKIQKALVVLLLLNAYQLFSQDFKIYSQGPVLQDILYENRGGIIENYNTSIFKGRRTNERNAFYEESDFFIYEMLTNGKISFGDTVSNYLNQILDYLQHKSGIQDDMQVVLLKSSEANAFMTKKGYLFITTGLIAQLNNESELAFVIAHEMIHKDKNHIQKEFDFSISDFNDELKSYGENLNYYSFSKELELEADELAIVDILARTDYDMEAAADIFDVLLYSHLPLNEVDLETRFLNHPNLIFPADYFLDEKDEVMIQNFEDYDDSESSHPNMKTRKEEFIETLVNTNYDLDRKVYVFGKEAFDHIQLLARNQYLVDLFDGREYSMVIQNAAVLTDLYPHYKEKYSEYVLRSLQALAEYKNWNDYRDLGLSIYRTEGETKKLNYFLKELTAKEMGILAVNYAYKLHKEYPDNGVIKSNYNWLLHNLVYFHEKKISDFKKEHQKPIEELDTLTEEEVEKLSKIQKIKYKQSIAEGNGSVDFINYALVDIINDSLFKYDFKNEYKAYKEEKQSDEYYSKKEWINWLERDNSTPNDNRALGINSIICVEPLIYQIDTRRNVNLKIDLTYKLRERYHEAMFLALKSSNIYYDYLSYDKILEDEIENFNEIAFLQNWFSQRLAHGNKEITVSDQTKIKEIVDKYDTPYAYFSGYMGVRVENNNALYGGMAVFYIITIPIAPYYFTEALINKYENLQFNYLFNLETGDALMVDYNLTQTMGAKDQLISTLYSSLIQISRSK